MAAIFISYRREDSAGWTGRLAERLKQKFGNESIFMDIDTIQAGTDFTEALRSAVGACDVLLAMIGPEWDIVKNSDGQARLQDPTDWVRTELTTALGRGIPVIPVLVGGASPPKLGTLPDDLKKLFNYQAHELTDKRWEYDSSQLVQVLEKVVRGAKPKRNIAQTILTSRSTWVAVVILGLLLTIGSIQFFKGRIITDDEASEKSESGASQLTVLAPSPEPKSVEYPIPAEKPTENTQSTVTQQEVTSPVATPITNTEASETPKLTVAAIPAGRKGRSLPAGIEVKFLAGDLTFRLVSIQTIEGESNDNQSLTTSFLMKNTGSSLARIYYGDVFRLLIDNSRRPPKTSPYSVDIGSDDEKNGDLTFTVHKAVERVGVRITLGKEETTIPIDLNSGVSRSDVHPPGIPRPLSKIARMENMWKPYGGVTYDFRMLMLEPYNIESFLLRISMRLTTNDGGWGFPGSNGFRIIIDNLPYAPLRATESLGLPPHTYGDAEVLFLVPKSATKALLRVQAEPGDNWRDVPIDLKAGKS